MVRRFNSVNIPIICTILNSLPIFINFEQSESFKMKIRIIKKITLLLIACVVQSCIYNENDIYFNEIDISHLPVITIQLNLDSLDTPTVNDSLEVLFNISVEGGELYWTRFVISDSIVYANDTASDRFWLTSGLVVGPGTYTLEMDAFYSSNTGSLADIIGIEALMKSKYYEIRFSQIN